MYMYTLSQRMMAEWLAPAGLSLWVIAIHLVY